MDEYAEMRWQYRMMGERHFRRTYATLRRVIARKWSLRRDSYISVSLTQLDNTNAATLTGSDDAGRGVNVGGSLEQHALREVSLKNGREDLERIVRFNIR